MLGSTAHVPWTLSPSPKAPTAAAAAGAGAGEAALAACWGASRLCGKGKWKASKITHTARMLALLVLACTGTHGAVVDGGMGVSLLASHTTCLPAHTPKCMQACALTKPTAHVHMDACIQCACCTRKPKHTSAHECGRAPCQDPATHTSPTGTPTGTFVHDPLHTRAHARVL